MTWSYGVTRDGHDDPSSESLTPWEDVHERPENDVPVPVPMSRVLARTEDVAVLLRSGGSSGGGRRYEQDWWASPLPPEGPLRVVVRWDAQGIKESVTELDGAVIAAAGRSSEELWPWEPELPEAEEPETSPWPADGWFAR